MQSEEDLEDIIFDHNDRPDELLVAVGYLHQQVEKMVSANALSESEIEHADEARRALINLHDELQVRKRKQILSESEIEDVAEKLDGVYGISGDIMSELSSVYTTIDRIDYPHPNPHSVAKESGGEAQDIAYELRNTAAESEVVDVYDSAEDRDGDGDTA